MAFPNLSEVVTTTLRSRTGELADNMSRNNAGLVRISKRGNVKPVNGGRTIRKNGGAKSARKAFKS